MCVTQNTSWPSPGRGGICTATAALPGDRWGEHVGRGGVGDPGCVYGGVCNTCHQGVPRKCPPQPPAGAPASSLTGPSARGTAGHGQGPRGLAAPGPGQCPGHVDSGPWGAEGDRGDPARRLDAGGGGGHWPLPRATHTLRPPPGCSGALARECVALYPGCHVTVFDIPEVVRTARKHFPMREEERERISFCEGASSRGLRGLGDGGGGRSPRLPGPPHGPLDLAVSLMTEGPVWRHLLCP